MKKIGIMLLMLLVFTIFTGCRSDKLDEIQSSTLPETDAPSTTEIVTFNENDIINIFKDDENNASFTATDSVVADDSAYGLIGIVQYTDEENNPCNLGFVNTEKWSYPIGLVADGGFRIADDSILTYLGEGKVSLILTEIETGKTYEYVVEYSHETDKTNFIVSSKER